MILPRYFPENPPIYDIDKTYEENAACGPFFSGEIPKRVFPPKEKWIDFLGHKVASPIGIPAGPLLTSRFIKLAGELGFDIPTYKTIRSHEHPAHPLPNMIFVDTRGTIRNQEEAVLQIKKPASDIASLAVTNSFGMPSKSPQFLLEDISRANEALHPGQVMIVSIVGSPKKGNFLRDFVEAASLAKDAGAKIIEANFSCPNVDKKEGCLYMSPDIVSLFASSIVRAIHPIPLIIKVGLFNNEEQMKETMIAIARSGVSAICGINTISMAVVNEKGDPALGENRLTSGICGGPIRGAALAFMRHAVKINRQEKLNLTLMGVGGITLLEHFDLFLQAGAEIAMTATGMIWDPYLAMRYHQRKNHG